MGNTVVHFEIPADDVAGLQTFYTGLFDWTIEKYPMEGMDYFGVMTAPQGGPGVNGGMMARMNPNQQGISVYFGVDSAQAAAEKAQALGGTVIVPTSPIPHVGYFAMIQDPQGNVFGVFQSDESVH